MRRASRRGASGAVAVLILGALFEMLHDLGDLDLGLADLAAADVEQLGGAAQLLRQLVDVDLLSLDPLQDPFELLHRLAEAERRLRSGSPRRGARLGRLRLRVARLPRLLRRARPARLLRRARCLPLDLCLRLRLQVIRLPLPAPFAAVFAQRPSSLALPACAGGKSNTIC